MSFCPNCGRELADNEVCSCQNQTAYIPQYNYTNQQGEPLFDEFGRPLFTAQGEPITYDENGKPKVKSNRKGCIIAIIICLLVFLFIAGIFAAILVPSMLGYTKKARANQANVNAKTIHFYANSTLEEIKEYGCSFDETYLISSDKLKNVNCEDIDTEIFYSTFENYASEDFASMDWFIVVEDGTAVYSAVYNNRFIGTFPPRALPNADNPSKIPLYTGDKISEDSDFDEVYEANCEKLFLEN